MDYYYDNFNSFALFLPSVKIHEDLTLSNHFLAESSSAVEIFKLIYPE